MKKCAAAISHFSEKLFIIIMNVDLEIYIKTHMRFYISIMKSEAATRGVLLKSCSQTFCNIYKKTFVLESLFNIVAALRACNFIKKRLQHRRLPVNMAKYLRAPLGEHL